MRCAQFTIFILLFDSVGADIFLFITIRRLFITRTDHLIRAIDNFIHTKAFSSLHSNYVRRRFNE